jgi:hypothetical protein
VAAILAEKAHAEPVRISENRASETRFVYLCLRKDSIESVVMWLLYQILNWRMKVVRNSQMYNISSFFIQMSEKMPTIFCTI